MIQQFLKHSLILNTCSPLPVSRSPTRVVQLLQLLNLHWHSLINQVCSSYSDSCLEVHSVGVDKWIVARIIIIVSHSIFTALAIFWTPPIHCLTYINLWQPLQFIFSIELPFPECHNVEVLQCITFSDWLIWLTDMHLSPSRVFSWLDSSSLFSAEYYSIVWMDHSLFIHSLTGGHLGCF